MVLAEAVTRVAYTSNRPPNDLGLHCTILRALCCFAMVYMRLKVWHGSYLEGQVGQNNYTPEQPVLQTLPASDLPGSIYTDPGEDPKSRTPQFWAPILLWPIDYRTCRWLYCLDPPKSLGMESSPRISGPLTHGGLSIPLSEDPCVEGI